jgi:hypothetical protein
VSGLLIDGQLHAVPGVEVISPTEEAWAHLDSGDGCIRPAGYRPQHKTLHKTVADDPEKVLAGAGPRGAEERAAINWANDTRHSGVQLVTGHDGRTANLADLLRRAAWHNGNYYANLRSWGHEVCELYGGGVYQAALDAAVAVTLVDTRVLGVQWQCPRAYKNNTPLPRFANGGVDLVGVFGHRDVSDNRGRWDPGDIVFDMLEAAGFERFDFYAGEDLDVWKKRQEWLKTMGVYTGAIDGIAGAGTTKALRMLGYPDGIWALGKTVADNVIPKPPAGVR